jgi:anhydro-N-acetylmuramic acid kinase
MIVAGIMSGTSADGINVAVVRILGRGPATRFSLLAEGQFPYPNAVRKMVLAVMNAGTASVADLSRLNFLMAELYADAVNSTKKKHGINKIELVGCHGQTIYHQGEAEAFLGKKLAVTWQIGEGAVVAQRVGAPVVSDFRPADMAAGGKGAPLVPLLDFLVYRHRIRGRILQNLGGIGNLSAIPAGAGLEDVIAFDTGPANMVIDACMEKLFQKRYDRDGRVAASGKVLDKVLSEFLKDEYFRQKPPKTAGREEFGREFSARFLRRCGRAEKADIIATATALTATSISHAIKKFVLEKASPDTRYRDFVVAGGGSRNRTLVTMLESELKPLALRLQDSSSFGVPAESKEAIAFALLAYRTWNREPGNVPSATGAVKPVILGKISHV